MKEVFVSDDHVYATGSAGIITDVKQVDLLLGGNFALFDDRNNLITAATTSANLYDSTQFYIAIGEVAGDGTIKTRRSRMIDRNAHVRKKTVPVTGTARVDTVGGAAAALNLPTTLVAGTSAILRIRRQNFMEDDSPLQGRQRNILPATNGINIDVVVVAGETDITLVPKIVTAINTHPANDQGDGTVWVTAASTGVSPNLGITLTAAIIGQEWHVAHDGILIDTIIALTTPTVYAQGLATQVSEDYQIAEIENGDTNRIDLPAFWFKKPSPVVALATYTAYHWEWKVEKRNSINSNNTSIQQVTLHIPSGATTLLALLDAALLILHSAGTTAEAGGSDASLGANP